MGSSVEIEERAGQWLARRDGGEWSAADETAFNTWLEQSTLHVVAFVRLEAAWKQATRLKALSAGVQPGTVPSPEQWSLARFFKQSDAASPGQRAVVRSRRFIPAALAASVLLAVAAGMMYFLGPLDSTYRTPVGGMASVPMEDGSKVMLNTDSSIRLVMSDTERKVELQQGEAYFAVARDPARPFVVSVGGKRIVAVGTAFSVRREGDQVRVVVTEGRVRIEGEDDAMLAAGAVARTNEAGVMVEQHPVADVEGILSWRSGHLTFRDAPLADAVAEFNRYNTRKIVIEDPAVANIRISGKFRSNQNEAFVRLVREGFPVRVREADQTIVLTGKL